MIPLVILWFSIENRPRCSLSRYGVYPICVNTFHGIRSVDSNLIEMARNYGVKGVALYRRSDFAGRAAVDSRRRALSVRADVGDADCRRGRFRRNRASAI